MTLRHLRSWTVLAAFVLFANAPMTARANENQSPRPEELQKQLDELLKKAAALQKAIDEMQPPTPPPDDLMSIEVVEAPPAPASAPAPAEEIQPIENAPAAATKIFNPDISVIGNLVGKAGDSNLFEFGPDEARGPFELQEVELALQAFVDPYAKGKFFLAIGEEGVEVEEGYAEFVALPWDLTAKAGKKKLLFGKANTFHTHMRPWIDQPLVLHNFFGDEGLADTGLSVSKLLPSSVFYIELTAEVMSGNAEGVFERQNANDLLSNAHLRVFRDISENSNIDVGTSYSRGTLPESGANGEFAGIDVTYRWKPLQRAIYRGFIGRLEWMRHDRGDAGDRRSGGYASAEWRLAQRWIAGARLDQASRDDFTDRGASLLITFQPSEFSQLRSQLRRTWYGGGHAVTEFLLQLQFSIGAHGAHTF